MAFSQIKSSVNNCHALTGHTQYGWIRTERLLDEDNGQTENKTDEYENRYRYKQYKSESKYAYTSEMKLVSVY